MHTIINPNELEKKKKILQTLKSMLQKYCIEFGNEGKKQVTT